MRKDTEQILKYEKKKKKLKNMGSRDSILLSTEDSCEAHSSFQIHLLWMNIYGSSFMKLTKKIHKYKPPQNDEIYI